MRLPEEGRFFRRGRYLVRQSGMPMNCRKKVMCGFLRFGGRGRVRNDGDPMVVLAEAPDGWSGELFRQQTAEEFRSRMKRHYASGRGVHPAGACRGVRGSLMTEGFEETLIKVVRLGQGRLPEPPRFSGAFRGAAGVAVMG